MHQSETWQTLLMACEAQDIGRPVEAEQLFAEAAPDFEYVRCSARALEAHRFFVDEGPDEYDHEDWEPLPIHEQRQAYVAEVRAIDWLKWRREIRATVNLAAFDDILIRMRSYANVIRPLWNGVFRMRMPDELLP